MHRSFYPTTREESKSNDIEHRSKKSDSLQFDTKEDEDKKKKKKRKRGEEEKIDGGESKHPEETAFRMGIKVIAER